MMQVNAPGLLSV